MDKKVLKNTLAEIAEQAVPAEKAPWEKIKQRYAVIQRREARQKETSMDKTSPAARARNLRWAATLAIITLLAMAAVLLTPQGRVWAQQVLGFFTRTDQTSFPLSADQIRASSPGEADKSPQPTASAPESYVFFNNDCAGQTEQAAYSCQAKLAEEQAGFTLQLIPLAENGLSFSSLALDTAQGQVITGYGYAGYPDTINSVILSQGAGDFPAGSDWDKTPEQYVQAVTVAGQPAEYVEGSFVVRPNASEATWETGIPMARLRWKVGDRWYELFKAGSPELVKMDQAAMIRIAESLAQIQ